MSIASEITRLQQAKADIKTAIENKGVTVPSNATLDAYDGYIDDIPSGGGGNWETIARGMIDQTTEFDMPDGIISASQMATNYVMNNRAGMKSFTIPNGATSIGVSFFAGCSKLTTIIIPNSVTSISNYAFQGCTSLVDITFGSGLTTFGQNVFQSCTALESITVPASVTNVGNGFMRQCFALKEVIMQGTTPPTMGANGFAQSNNLQAIYVPDASVAAYQGTSNWTSFASKIKGISERPTT